MRVTHVGLPFNLTEADLVLDPGTGERGIPDLLDFDLALKEDELRRVIICAALLLEVGAGNVAQCLDTALVWERG
jgi:hypothetical protein